MVMKLLNYCCPEHCITSLKAASRAECLEVLCERLAELGRIEDAQEMLEALLAREAVESTGIGGGIAIPHVRSRQLNGSIVMIANLAEPIEFEAKDGEPVDLIFLLLGSLELPGQQLRVLARISKLVRIDSFLADLRAAKTPAEVIAALREVEAKHF
jgi:mannitol/fructose-specific phosphotransferase system IIA component (Ntr-type)